ncbi:MAG: Uma2 family endonuclease [Richelia sp. RM2_1_2]|nr:Uma2 family endonuclease [Richelia sp. SM1_7_0]NJN11757.1 Uma2 family endonuclease [Richelia sp. RM1_1_1]NJO57657.1 Uma2 family endonuclease [Richelia sp. RM2_1_2]
MIQILTKKLTFQEFVDWKPEDKLYELHDGVVVEVAQPIGKHENVFIFLSRKINVEIDRFNLPYGIPSKVLVKPEDKNSAYYPDILVLDKRNLKNESLYEKESTVSQPESIPLVIEIVSTNWGDDYAVKFEEYENIGIPEYVIVDYLGLGGKRFIGSPKRPTITVCQLKDGEYTTVLYQDDETIELISFPELKLTANQIFQSAETEY